MMRGGPTQVPPARNRLPELGLTYVDTQLINRCCAEI